MDNPPLSSKRNHRQRFPVILLKSLACLYLPFLWLIPACRFMSTSDIIMAFVWFPGLIPALSWWGRENHWVAHSLMVAAILLVSVFLLIRQGGWVAKLTMVITVIFALLMSLMVRYLLLV